VIKVRAGTSQTHGDNLGTTGNALFDGPYQLSYVRSAVIVKGASYEEGKFRCHSAKSNAVALDGRNNAGGGRSMTSSVVIPSENLAIWECVIHPIDLWWHGEVGMSERVTAVSYTN
jgi:hypothetical protein